MSAVDVVVRFFAALEAGDIEQVRALYSPDALIWHNDDLIEQSMPDNLKVLAGYFRHFTQLARRSSNDGPPLLFSAAGQQQRWDIDAVSWPASPH